MLAGKHVSGTRMLNKVKQIKFSQADADSPSFAMEVPLNESILEHQMSKV